MTWKIRTLWRDGGAILRGETAPPSGTTAPAALNTHSFGLPVIATDVGSLRSDIMEAKTGFLCRANNPADLTRTIRTYFASDLYRNLEVRRSQIREFANERSLPMSGTRRQAWGRFWMGFIEGCL
jgi:glycosyltransferase involved in cell wall biosynthesis